MQHNAAEEALRCWSRVAYERDQSSVNSDVFSGESHLGGSSLQNLDENVARRSYEAGSDAGANLLDRRDDFRVTAQQMLERGIEIVHHHTEMIDALSLLALRKPAGLRVRQRRDEKIDVADAQIHASRTSHDFSVQTARKPCGGRFGVCRAQLQMIPLEFNHSISLDSRKRHSSMRDSFPSSTEYENAPSRQIAPIRFRAQ